MDPKFEELDVQFSTADASMLNIVCSARSLTVTFADWRGTKSTVIFEDVAAYKWDESSFERIDASPIALTAFEIPNGSPAGQSVSATLTMRSVSAG